MVPAAVWPMRMPSIWSFRCWARSSQRSAACAGEAAASTVDPTRANKALRRNGSNVIMNTPRAIEACARAARKRRSIIVGQDRTTCDKRVSRATSQRDQLTRNVDQHFQGLVGSLMDHVVDAGDGAHGPGRIGAQPLILRSEGRRAPAGGIDED